MVVSKFSDYTQKNDVIDCRIKKYFSEIWDLLVCCRSLGAKISSAFPLDAESFPDLRGVTFRGVAF